MKYLSYLLLSTLLICITSCDKEENNNNQLNNSGLLGTWHMINSSGGFAGSTCIYQSGEVVLTFDSDANLTIVNNVLNTTALCGGQEIGTTTGSHSYGVLDSNDKKYLLIDGEEMGELIVTNEEFLINQNNSSEGSNADLYFLTFAK